MSKKMTYISLVVAIVACILSFAGGYSYRGTIDAEAEAVAEEPTVEQTVLADSVDQAAKDTTTVVAKDTTATAARPAAQEPAQQYGNMHQAEHGSEFLVLSCQEGQQQRERKAHRGISQPAYLQGIGRSVTHSVSFPSVGGHDPSRQPESPRNL